MVVDSTASPAFRTFMEKRIKPDQTESDGGTVPGRGRPKSSNKSAVSLRIDNDILKALRATGEGWQTRLNDLLRAALALGSRG
jgi:uncharacterized protein (DUF4415 family)